MEYNILTASTSTIDRPITSSATSSSNDVSPCILQYAKNIKSMIKSNKFIQIVKTILKIITDGFQKFFGLKTNRGSTSETSGNKNNIKFNIESNAKNNNAARKIQRAYRKFLARKNSKPVNEFGAKVMINEKVKVMIDRKPEDIKRTFYFPQSNQPNVKGYFRNPDGEVENQYEDKGSFKSVTHRDDRFVQLHNNQFDSTYDAVADVKKVNELAAELSKFSSICRFFYADNDTLLAENGGKDLVSRLGIEKTGTLVKTVCSLNVFKAACEELEKMHNQDIFLRDIKLENMVVKEDENIARHIDHDLIVTPNYGDYRRPEGTSIMLIAELCLIRTNPNVDERTVKKSLAACDNIAMALSIMSAVDCAVRIDINSAFGNSGGTCLNLYGFESAACCKFIKTHVKPKYQKAFRMWLKRPAKNPLPGPLHRMFKWSNEPPRIYTIRPNFGASRNATK